jgi:hypothetical protein
MEYSIDYLIGLLAYALSGLDNAGRIRHLGRSYRETTNFQRLTKGPQNRVYTLSSIPQSNIHRVARDT